MIFPSLLLSILIFCPHNYADDHQKMIDAMNKEEPETIEDTIKQRMSCSPMVCQGRGECLLDEFHRPSCACYMQWYQGPKCTALPQFCSTESTVPVFWMPRCDFIGNYQCYNAFGTYTCLCNPDYTGRTCQTPRPSILG